MRNIVIRITDISHSKLEGRIDIFATEIILLCNKFKIILSQVIHRNKLTTGSQGIATINKESLFRNRHNRDTFLSKVFLRFKVEFLGAQYIVFIFINSKGCIL